MNTAVKSKTRLALILCLVAALAVTAAAGPASAEEGDTLLVAYIIGVDLEKEDNSASDNLIELIKSWNPASGQALIFYGSCDKPGWNEGTSIADFTNLKKDYETDGVIGSDNGVATSSIIGKLASPTGSQSGLEEAVAYVNKYADENGLGNAHRYLIFWDHGAGYNGIGSGDARVSNAQTAAGLSKTSKKFDIIIYDTCLMANLEAAYAVKPYGDYLLASEESAPGSGLDWTAISSALAPSASKDPKTVASTIMDGYLNKENKNGKTISLTDLSKIDNVVYNADKLGDSLKDIVNSPDTQNALGYAYQNTEKYGSSKSNIDLYDLASHISSAGGDNIRESASGLMAAVNDAVVISKKGDGHDQAHGLSIANIAQFSPGDINEKVTLSNGGWAEFLKGYTSVLSGENNAQYSYSSSTSSGEEGTGDRSSDKKKVSTGTLSVENDNGRTVVYVDYLYLSDGKYYIVGQEQAEQSLEPTQGNSNWAYLPSNEYKTGDNWECTAFVLKNDEGTVPLTLLDPEEYTESDGTKAVSYLVYGNMTRTVNGKDVTHPSYLTVYVNPLSGKVYDIALNSITSVTDNNRRMNLWGSENVLKGDRFTPTLDYFKESGDDNIYLEESKKSFVFSDNPCNDLKLVELDEDKCYWEYEISSISDSVLDKPVYLHPTDFVNGSVSANHSASANPSAQKTAAPKSPAPVLAVVFGLCAACVFLRKF